MLEIVKNVPTAKLEEWLEKYVQSHLTRDVSRYAKNRLRVWLKFEPSLTAKPHVSPGLDVTDEIWNRLIEIVGWPFDYCLVTYSGEEGIGIAPHRDASFADYEAWGLNVAGQCEFSYWNDRKSFGPSKPDGFSKYSDEPTHKLIIEPGDVVRFNCKNLHAASPSAKRWNLNFWRKKPG